MRNSEFLYGSSYDATILRGLMYPKALLQKIIWAKQTTDELLQAPIYERDFSRINKIAESVRHNSALFDECYWEGL